MLACDVRPDDTLIGSTERMTGACRTCQCGGGGPGRHREREQERLVDPIAAVILVTD